MYQFASLEWFVCCHNSAVTVCFRYVTCNYYSGDIGLPTCSHLIFLICVFCVLHLLKLFLGLNYRRFWFISGQYLIFCRNQAFLNHAWNQFVHWPVRKAAFSQLQIIVGGSIQHSLNLSTMTCFMSFWLGEKLKFVSAM